MNDKDLINSTRFKRKDAEKHTDFDTSTDRILTLIVIGTLIVSFIIITK